MITANNPSLRSWVSVEKKSDFPIQNLPFGIFSTSQKSPRVGVALGNYVIDLSELHKHGYIKSLGIDQSVFEQHTLNPFMELGKQATRNVRNALSDLFSITNESLQNDKDAQKEILVSMEEATMHMPVHIGDYTDFYSSKEHATNVGTMFRDPNNALLPNWLHIPVGYHGRSSSIILSGQEIHRPKGQQKPNDDEPPVFGPSKLLDFELEMAFITYGGNDLGDSISTSDAENHIFGMVLFNDWSARDIQKWEYVPLGPFLAKNFASSMSPWIVTMDALDAFRVETPTQDPEPLPYLQFEGKKSYDIALEVGITPNGGKETVVCNSNYKYMYWNMSQQLAHHTVNGCNIRVGDMLASGTISGPTEDSYGSMLELSWRGTKPLKLSDGTERKFIQDGDTVTMRGTCERDGVRIGFGEVATKVLPTK